MLALFYVQHGAVASDKEALGLLNINNVRFIIFSLLNTLRQSHELGVQHLNLHRGNLFYDTAKEVVVFGGWGGSCNNGKFSPAASLYAGCCDAFDALSNQRKDSVPCAKTVYDLLSRDPEGIQLKILMDFNIRKPLANAAEKFNCLVADPKLRIEEGHSALKVIKTLLVGTVQDGLDLISDWIIAEGTASETIFVPTRFCQINGRVVHPAVICFRDCVDNNGNKIRALGVKAYSCVPARGVAAGYGGRSIDYPYSTYLVSLNRATHL